MLKFLINKIKKLKSKLLKPFKINKPIEISIKFPKKSEITFIPDDTLVLVAYNILHIANVINLKLFKKYLLVNINGSWVGYNLNNPNTVSKIIINLNKLILNHSDLYYVLFTDIIKLNNLPPFSTVIDIQFIDNKIIINSDER